MPDWIVVDANVMSDYRKEILNGIHGINVDTIDTIFEKCQIGISPIIEQEWLNTCGRLDFKEWMTDCMKEGRIIMVKNPAKLPQGIKKTIYNKYGFPRSRDIEYIVIANSSNIKIILTNDIHFYDPKQENASQKIKDSIKINRSGRLCRFLESTLDIRVGLCCHCLVFLNI